MKITGSLVTYHNNFEDLQNVFDSFLNTDLDIRLFISDNSSNKSIEKLCIDSRVEYIFNNSNKGFGTAHNVGIKKAEELNSTYHFIINPDVYFDKGTLENMVDFMEKNKDIGLLMPKILYPNGDIQYVCKLLPTPFNFFARSLLPNWKWVQRINDRFEMKFTEYDKVMEVPYISGCFMCFRTPVLKDIGYFDENIFLHLEDTDISRRTHKKYRTVMLPSAIVYHKWEKATYKSKKIRNATIKSAIYYFNKYGWFFDKERRKINDFIIKNFFLGSK